MQSYSWNQQGLCRFHCFSFETEIEVAEPVHSSPSRSLLPLLRWLRRWCAMSRSEVEAMEWWWWRWSGSGRWSLWSRHRHGRIADFFGRNSLMMPNPIEFIESSDCWDEVEIPWGSRTANGFELSSMAVLQLPHPVNWNFNFFDPIFKHLEAPHQPPFIIASLSWSFPESLQQTDQQIRSKKNWNLAN